MHSTTPPGPGRQRRRRGGRNRERDRERAREWARTRSRSVSQERMPVDGYWVDHSPPRASPPMPYRGRSVPLGAPPEDLYPSAPLPPRRSGMRPPSRPGPLAPRAGPPVSGANLLPTGVQYPTSRSWGWGSHEPVREPRPWGRASRGFTSNAGISSGTPASQSASLPHVDRTASSTSSAPAVPPAHHHRTSSPSLPSPPPRQAMLVSRSWSSDSEVEEGEAIEDEPSYHSHVRAHAPPQHAYRPEPPQSLALKPEDYASPVPARGETARGPAPSPSTLAKQPSLAQAPSKQVKQEESEAQAGPRSPRTSASPPPESQPKAPSPAVDGTTTPAGFTRWDDAPPSTPPRPNGESEPPSTPSRLPSVGPSTERWHHVEPDHMTSTPPTVPEQLAEAEQPNAVELSAVPQHFNEPEPAAPLQQPVGLERPAVPSTEQSNEARTPTTKSAPGEPQQAELARPLESIQAPAVELEPSSDSAPPPGHQTRAVAEAKDVGKEQGSAPSPTKPKQTASALLNEPPPVVAESVQPSEQQRPSPEPTHPMEPPRLDEQLPVTHGGEAEKDEAMDTAPDHIAPEQPEQPAETAQPPAEPVRPTTEVDAQPTTDLPQLDAEEDMDLDPQQPEPAAHPDTARPEQEASEPRDTDAAPTSSKEQPLATQSETPLAQPQPRATEVEASPPQHTELQLPQQHEPEASAPAPPVGKPSESQEQAAATGSAPRTPPRLDGTAPPRPVEAAEAERMGVDIVHDEGPVDEAHRAEASAPEPDPQRLPESLPTQSTAQPQSASGASGDHQSAPATIAPSEPMPEPASVPPTSTALQTEPNQQVGTETSQDVRPQADHVHGPSGSGLGIGLDSAEGLPGTGGAQVPVVVEEQQEPKSNAPEAHQEPASAPLTAVADPDEDRRSPVHDKLDTFKSPLPKEAPAPPTLPDSTSAQTADSAVSPLATLANLAAQSPTLPAEAFPPPLTKHPSGESVPRSDTAHPAFESPVPASAVPPELSITGSEGAQLTSEPSEPSRTSELIPHPAPRNFTSTSPRTTSADLPAPTVAQPKQSDAMELDPTVVAPTAQPALEQTTLPTAQIASDVRSDMATQPERNDVDQAETEAEAAAEQSADREPSPSESEVERQRTLIEFEMLQKAANPVRDQAQQDAIYRTNQRVAQSMHTKLVAPRAFPEVYFEAGPLWLDMDAPEIKRTQRAILHRESDIRRRLRAKEERLRGRYRELNRKWSTHCSLLDEWNERKERAEAAAEAASAHTEPEPVGSVSVTPIPGRANRRNNHFSSGQGAGQGGFAADSVRSEAEFLEILASLESADMQDPTMRAARTTAKVPDQVLNPDSVTIKSQEEYDDSNHAVLDPVAFYLDDFAPPLWTEEEQTTFKRRFGMYPKQFGKIAAALPYKSPEDCVRFYYATKKLPGWDYRALAAGRSGGGKKKKTTRKTKKARGNALMVDVASASNKTEIADQGEDGTGTPVGGDKRKSLASAGPSPDLASAAPPTSGAAELDAPSPTTTGPPASAGRKRSAPTEVDEDGKAASKAKRPRKSGTSHKKSKSGPSSGSAAPPIDDSNVGMNTVAEARSASMAEPSSDAFGDLAAAAALEALAGAGPGPSKSPGPGATATATGEKKKRARGTTSSYWSRAERTEFLRSLAVYGKAWTVMCTTLTSKSAAQARNYYRRHENDEEVRSALALADANKPKAVEVRRAEAEQAFPVVPEEEPRAPLPTPGPVPSGMDMRRSSSSTSTPSASQPLPQPYAQGSSAATHAATNAAYALMYGQHATAGAAPTTLKGLPRMGAFTNDTSNHAHAHAPTASADYHHTSYPTKPTSHAHPVPGQSSHPPCPTFGQQPQQHHPYPHPLTPHAPHAPHAPTQYQSSAPTLSSYLPPQLRTASAPAGQQYAPSPAPGLTPVHPQPEMRRFHDLIHPQSSGRPHLPSALPRINLSQPQPSDQAGSTPSPVTSRAPSISQPHPHHASPPLPAQASDAQARSQHGPQMMVQAASPPRLPPPTRGNLGISSLLNSDAPPRARISPQPVHPAPAAPTPQVTAPASIPSARSASTSPLPPHESPAPASVTAPATAPAPAAPAVPVSSAPTPAPGYAFPPPQEPARFQAEVHPEYRSVSSERYQDQRRPTATVAPGDGTDSEDERRRIAAQNSAQDPARTLHNLQRRESYAPDYVAREPSGDPRRDYGSRPSSASGPRPVAPSVPVSEPPASRYDKQYATDRTMPIPREQSPVQASIPPLGHRSHSSHSASHSASHSHSVTHHPTGPSRPYLPSLAATYGGIPPGSKPASASASPPLSLGMGRPNALTSLGVYTSRPPSASSSMGTMMHGRMASSASHPGSSTWTLADPPTTALPTTLPPAQRPVYDRYESDRSAGSASRPTSRPTSREQHYDYSPAHVHSPAQTQTTAPTSSTQAHDYEPYAPGRLPSSASAIVRTGSAHPLSPAYALPRSNRTSEPLDQSTATALPSRSPTLAASPSASSIDSYPRGFARLSYPSGSAAGSRYGALVHAHLPATRDGPSPGSTPPSNPAPAAQPTQPAQPAPGPAPAAQAAQATQPVLPPLDASPRTSHSPNFVPRDVRQYRRASQASQGNDTEDHGPSGPPDPSA